jgi:hypothetical protein
MRSDITTARRGLRSLTVARGARPAGDYVVGTGRGGKRLNRDRAETQVQPRASVKREARMGPPDEPEDDDEGR